MATITVTNLNDSGAGSLRQAIIDANATTAADTIEFNVAGGGGLITLTSGSLAITSDITIIGDTTGDGTADITISGNDAARIFSATGSSTDFEIRSLDLTNGFTDVSGGAAVFSTANSLRIVNSTIRDSVADSSTGGGVSASNAVIVNSTFVNNEAEFGGAVFGALGGNILLVGSTLSGNSAVSEGGAIDVQDGTNVVIKGSTITNNTAANGGGIAIFSNSAVSLYNSIVSGNQATTGPDIAKTGTGVGTLYAATSVLGLSVTPDTSSGTITLTNDPGIYALADNGGPVLTHSLRIDSPALSAGDVTKNEPDTLDVDNDGNTTEAIPLDANGGARAVGAGMDIGAFEGVLDVVVDTLVDENDGDFSAGDLSLREALTIVSEGGTITFDADLTGGSMAGVDDGVITLGGTELSINSSVTINGDVDGNGTADITISGNDASRIFNTAGASTDFAIRSLDLTNGYSTGSGGAIYAIGSQLTLINSTIRASEAYTGGGIFSNQAVVTNSTISGNTAGGYGGGFYVRGGGALFLTGSTVSGNSAGEDGGGIDTGENANLAVTNATITDNTAGQYGGGIALYTLSELYLYNSIVSGNTGDTGDNILKSGFGDGTIVGGFNLVGTGITFDTDAGGNVISNTPGLDPLAENGGPVQTHALTRTSDALSAGNAAFLPVDTQDVDNDGDLSETLPLDANGNARVQGTLDIGASENVLNVVVDTLVDENDGDFSMGDLSLREALEIVAEGGTITFDASITGGSTAGVNDGVITLGGTQLEITQDVTIDGDVDGDNKADITISGDNTSRIFNANTFGTDITLNSLDVTNGNAGANPGGAIYTTGGVRLYVTNSTVRDSTTAGSGGGITTAFNLTVTNSTISGNNGRYGGGINSLGSGTANIINTTISGNTGVGSGGIEAAGGLFLRSSTVVGNTITATNPDAQASGVGFYGNFATGRIENSIVSGNTGGIADVRVEGLAPGTFSAQNSLLGTTTTPNLNNGGNIYSNTPGLGALADNGGPVQTMAILPGSAAIDAGDAMLLPADTRDLDSDGNTAEDLPIDANGNARIIDTLDIGAVELASAPDLTVTNFQITKTSAILGEAINYSFDWANLGDAEAIGAQALVTVSENANLDPLTGPQFVIGADFSPNSSTPVDVDLFLQGFIAPGTYFVGAITDFLDDFDESDETNNVSNTVEITITGIGPVTIPNPGGPTGGFTLLQNAVNFASDGNTVNVDATTYQGNPETVNVTVDNLTFDLPSGVTPTFLLEDGPGQQISFTNSGDVTAIGGNGDDTVNGGDGDDTLIGGVGMDSLSGGGGTNTADYSGSSARVEIDLAMATAVGGDAAGDTLINIQNLIGSDRNDRLVGGSETNLFEGGMSADNLNGRGGDDTLRGDTGGDVLSGGNNDDRVEGGDDNDNLFGNGGADTILGGQGEDTIAGGVGSDSLIGGSENDSIIGQGQDDTIRGSDGNDILRGGSGNDSIQGGADNDDLFGQGNNDTLEGGGGNDSLFGGAGSDQLFGNAGDDTLSGSVGSDRLDGGAGNDVLNGNGSTPDGVRDVYVFGVGYDEDRINGFDQAGTDRIELDDALWLATSGVLTRQAVVDTFGTLNGPGNILTLDFGGGDILEVQNSGGISQATLGIDIVIV